MSISFFLLQYDIWNFVELYLLTPGTVPLSVCHPYCKPSFYHPSYAEFVCPCLTQYFYIALFNVDIDIPSQEVQSFAPDSVTFLEVLEGEKGVVLV